MTIKIIEETPCALAEYAKMSTATPPRHAGTSPARAANVARRFTHPSGSWGRAQRRAENTPASTITIIEETPSALADYAQISIAFRVESHLRVDLIDNGLAGI